MPPVRVKYVASFSSQDPRHTVENLVKGRGSWLSHPTEKMSRLQADLQLEWATTITYIDIGNAGSVMVSVEVGRSSWPTSQPLVTLLPAVSLMTAEEWRAGRNISTVRMFKPVDLSSEALKEKWDKVRVVCLQPFRKDTTQFGLSLFRLHTNVEVSSEAALDKRIIDLDSNTPQTALKKDELVSRMNLSEVKKKTISQKIGWLENKVLNNSEEGNAGPPLNPLMSPVSRAGRLISMASKPQTKMGADIHKSELECEALEFLISLNLSLEDIYSLKVLGKMMKPNPEGNAKNKSNSFSSKEDGHQTITWISRSTNYNDNTPGYCLGSKPLDKYGTSKGRKGSMKDGLENGGGSSPLNTDCNIAMVECPVCSDNVYKDSSKEAEAVCRIKQQLKTFSNQNKSLKKKQLQYSVFQIFCYYRIYNNIFFSFSQKHTKDVEECPVCGALISKSELNDHAADCASAMFD
nr:DNA repair protein XRCC1-like [Cherax quadricarinatus]